MKLENGMSIRAVTYQDETYWNVHDTDGTFLFVCDTREDAELEASQYLIAMQAVGSVAWSEVE